MNNFNIPGFLIKTILTWGIFQLSFVPQVFSFTAADSLKAKAYGVLINVSDLKNAKEFYVDILKFGVDGVDIDANVIQLKTKSGDKIIIRQISSSIKSNSGAQSNVSLALQVNNLDSSVMYLKSKGIRFTGNERRKEGVGFSAKLLDPFGNMISLLEQTIQAVPRFEEPSIYNFGLYIPDIQTEQDFYCNGMGFKILTKRYLPEDMPLFYADRSFGFMLHLNREEFKPDPQSKGVVPAFMLMFKTDNLSNAIDFLKQNKATIADVKPRQWAWGNYVVFKDAAGIEALIMDNK